jgi:hypothetical protein
MMVLKAASGVRAEFRKKRVERHEQDREWKGRIAKLCCSGASGEVSTRHAAAGLLKTDKAERRGFQASIAKIL